MEYIKIGIFAERVGTGQKEQVSLYLQRVGAGYFDNFTKTICCSNMPVYYSDDEKLLFIKISEGNEIAFRQLFELYRERLYHFVLQMVKSTFVAEELVQEVFIKIWTNREVLDKVENPNTYIFVITRNKTIDRLRKIARESRLVNEFEKVMDTRQNTSEEIMEANESQRCIDRALETLSPQKQKIFQLSRYGGFSHEEIGKQLNLSKSTVKNNLVEILKYLKVFLRHHHTAFFIIGAITIFHNH